MLSESIEISRVGTKLTESLKRFRVSNPGVDFAHIKGFVSEITEDVDGVGLELTLDLVPIGNHTILLSTEPYHDIHRKTLQRTQGLKEMI